MYSVLKHHIYYVLIIGQAQNDHIYLRKVMNRLLPQAIIESLYGDNETLTYLTQSSITPNLILLDQETQHINGLQVMKLIRSNDQLCEVPVILLTPRSSGKGIDYSTLGASELGCKPLTGDVDQMASEIRRQWYISSLNHKNIS